MLEFRDAGKTLILVTHDLGAIESFCDRAIWLDEGHPRRRHAEAITAATSPRSRAGRALLGAAGRCRPRARHLPPADQRHDPICLSSMSFADDDGTERDVFHNGEAMRVRIHYPARMPVRSPIFELAIDRHDGAHVTTARPARPSTLRTSPRATATSSGGSTTYG